MNGGAVYCTDNANPILKNTILYGNTASTSGAHLFLNDEGSDPDFYYCDVQGGKAAFAVNSNFYTGIYQSNIDADPLFVAPSGYSGIDFNGITADWSLQAGSPCINTGDPNGSYPATDLEGNPRISASIIDMGAYESPSVTGIGNNNYSEGAMHIYPNPNNGSFIIEMNTGVAGAATVSVINILGETIYTEEQIINSSFGLPVTLKLISEGLYIVKVQTGKEIMAKRMLIK